MELRRRASDLRQRVAVALTALGLPARAISHASSPIPTRADVRESISSNTGVPSSLPGIDLNVDAQIALVRQFSSYYEEQPFAGNPQEGVRFYFENPYFGYGDALMLYCMMRHLDPVRIIEVGSGFSSALMLDTNERYLNGRVQCTFIDPRPDRLYSLLDDRDRAEVTIIPSSVQSVDHRIFENLQASDILFIDSSHVSKVGSDVNYLLFEVLPLLRPGVIVHIHDIFYPFEYPAATLRRGKAWNEAYILRAFLLFNEEFDIRLFNSYLATSWRHEVSGILPLWERNPGGSLWLERHKACQ